MLNHAHGCIRQYSLRFTLFYASVMASLIVYVFLQGLSPRSGAHINQLKSQLVQGRISGQQCALMHTTLPSQIVFDGINCPAGSIDPPFLFFLNSRMVHFFAYPNFPCRAFLLLQKTAQGKEVQCYSINVPPATIHQISYLVGLKCMIPNAGHWPYMRRKNSPVAFVAHATWHYAISRGFPPC